jgi:hypothetical protein
MTSTKPIFSTFLGNAQTWQQKWIDFGSKPIQFGEKDYVEELTPFFGLTQFNNFSEEEKKKLFFEYVKLVGEAQILLEQILIYGFFHYRKKRKVYDEEVNQSMDKLSLEELYHSQAFRDFLGGVPELEWKEKPIYPKGSLLRKSFALLIKWAPLGMTLPGAKIEAFSLAYYKLLKKHYPHELDNSWIELSYYHHQDEAYHVPLEFDIYNSTIIQSGAFKTLFSTLLISLRTSLIMVLLVLLVLWRGKKEAPLWPLLVSGFWGVAFILVLLAVSQFKLNFVTCVVLAILVGMTGDNAIHFLLGGSDLEKGIEEKQGASVLTTTIMSLCCVVFFFFSFQPPRVLGILLIFGLWGSLAGDLWFLKSLVKTSPKNS